MELRPPGRTGVQVSKLCLGAMMLRLERDSGCEQVAAVAGNQHILLEAHAAEAL